MSMKQRYNGGTIMSQKKPNQSRVLSLDTESLISEMVEYAKSVDFRENHDFYGYFEQNGFEYSPYSDIRYQTTMKPAIDKAWAIVQDLKQKRNRDRLLEEKAALFKYLPEALEWMNQKGLKKMSKPNLALFLFEKNLKPGPVNRQAFYLELNATTK